MPTDDEIERLVRIAEEGEPIGPMVDLRDLGSLGVAMGTVRSAEATVRVLATLARLNGRSWEQIGVTLDLNPEEARERFCDENLEAGLATRDSRPTAPGDRS